MKTRSVIRAALGAFIALGLAAAAAAEERSLLTADGTLYHVRSGLYSSVEPGGSAAQPNDVVIRWDSLDQSGVALSGIIPGTDNANPKDEFDLAYDSLSRSLILVWNDRMQVINSIQFAVLQKGIWTQSQLIPSGMFTFASNPQILITHQTLQDLDVNGNEYDSPRSIISVIWWEGSIRSRARFVPIFVENGSLDLADVQIYDLPELVGSQTVAAGSEVLDNPLYAAPTMQQEGLSSTILATFADVATATLQVARISFPSDFRHVIDPMHGRHVVVILGHNSAPILSAVPSNATLLGTVVGGSYLPTVYWQSDPSSLSFASTDGTTWSGTRSIPLTRTLNADAAVTLIRRMAIQD